MKIIKGLLGGSIMGVAMGVAAGMLLQSKYGEVIGEKARRVWRKVARHMKED